MIRYFFSISISELQQWLADNILSVPVYRIIHLKQRKDNKYNFSDLEDLFKNLPVFSIDDIAGVVIVELDKPNNWGFDESPLIRNLDLSNVRNFFALTEDAVKALSITKPQSIRLTESIFEKEFIIYRIKKKANLANQAGEIFSAFFVDNTHRKFKINEKYVASLPRAIMAVEGKNQSEINYFSGGSSVDDKETWIELAFRYTRHVAISKPDNIKSLFDVGLIIRDKISEPDHPLKLKLRSIVSSKKDVFSFKELYSDKEIFDLKINLNTDGSCQESINLVTLSLFLRWKQSFYDNHESIDPAIIHHDIKALSGVVAFEVVLNALWLMGAYLGMDSISPIYRCKHKEKYKALDFPSSYELNEPIPCWDVIPSPLNNDGGFDPFKSDHQDNTPENHHGMEDENTVDDQIDNNKTDLKNESSTSLEQSSQFNLESDNTLQNFRASRSPVKEKKQQECDFSEGKRSAEVISNSLTEEQNSAGLNSNNSNEIQSFKKDDEVIFTNEKGLLIEGKIVIEHRKVNTDVTIQSNDGKQHRISRSKLSRKL